MFLDEVGKTRNLLTADIHGSTRIKICLPAHAFKSQESYPRESVKIRGLKLYSLKT